jgi:hypothetical protein
MQNLTLIETYDLEKVCYLIQNRDIIGDDENNKVYNFLVKILHKDGKLEINYNYGKGIDYGRLYGNGIQNIKKEIRNFLCEGKYDIDMKTCHPTILYHLCKKYDIPDTYKLKEWVENREFVIKQYFGNNKEIAKDLVNKCIFGDNPSMTTYTWLQLFVEHDINSIKKFLCSHKDFEKVVKDVKSKKKENLGGSIVSRICNVYENEIISYLYKKLNDKGIKTFALMFDGLITNQKSEDISKDIQIAFDDNNITFLNKIISSDIKIPESYSYDIDQIKFEYCKDYESVKKWWENTYKAYRIISKGSYWIYINDKYHYYDRNTLVESFQHIKIDVSDDMDDSVFIKKWICDENIPIKFDVGMYPDSSKCPKNILNLWKPYDVELWDEVGDDTKAVEFFKNHVGIVCNHEQPVIEMMIKWLAHIFKFPDEKSICPIFNGLQGVGKDSIIKFISEMIGHDKYFLSETPERDVWGHFNGGIANSKLVHLSEIDRTNVMNCMGKIKGLITDDTITINEKCQKPYTINSYQVYVIVTNNDEPVKIQEGDRRFTLIRTSAEKKGDAEYFNVLYSLLKNKNSLKSIYNYLMTVDCPRVFNYQHIAHSEYHQEILHIEDPEEIRFLKEFVAEKKCNTTHRVIDIFKHFMEWRIINSPNSKIEWNLIKFGIKTSAMAKDIVNGIIKTRNNKEAFISLDYIILKKKWLLDESYDIVYDDIHLRDDNL